MPMKLSWLALVAAALWTSPADACRCEQQTLEAYFGNADIVLLVDVVNVTHVASTDDASPHLSAEPRIIEAFKAAPDVTHVKTTDSSASCGIPLEAGQRYWVFAQRRPGETAAWIDSCNGSRQIDSDFSNVVADRVAERLRDLVAAPPATAPPGEEGSDPIHVPAPTPPKQGHED